VAQVVKCLPSKLEAPSSIPKTTKKKKKIWCQFRKPLDKFRWALVQSISMARWLSWQCLSYLPVEEIAHIQTSQLRFPLRLPQWDFISVHFRDAQKGKATQLFPADLTIRVWPSESQPDGAGKHQTLLSKYFQVYKKCCTYNFNKHSKPLGN
jgi:hypothetical protein